MDTGSAGYVEKPNLLCMRPIEQIDRIGRRLQQHLAALLGEIGFSFRRQVDITLLARAENYLLTPAANRPKAMAVTMTPRLASTSFTIRRSTLEGPLKPYNGELKQPQGAYARKGSIEGEGAGDHSMLRSGPNQQ
jgi:hypothetical protein